MQIKSDTFLLHPFATLKHLKPSAAPAKTFKVVQLHISAAKSAKSCSNLSHNMPKISGKNLALQNHSIASLDPLERSSDKHGQEELQSNLRPPCNTPVRAKRFWLVRLKVDQALVGLLACHAECSSEVARCQRSPTHLHGLQPFLGKSQDGLTSADEPKTTKITKLYIVIPSSNCLPCKSYRIPAHY